VNPQMEPEMGPRRLYRTADDRILAGVAGGLAAYFDIDPVIVRIIWFLSVFFTGSLTFWIYLVMIVVVPPEPVDWPTQAPWTGGQPSGFQATYTPPTQTAPGGTPDPGSSAGPGFAAPPDAPGSTGPAGGTPAGGAPAAPAFGPGTPPGTPPASGGWWGDDWRWQRRQERWQRRQERWQRRWADGQYHRERSGAGLVFGLLLILGGGMLAWHQIDPSFDLGLTWPVLIVAVGLILVASSIRIRD